jgi:xylan 1,4-beta-xylosidase
MRDIIALLNSENLSELKKVFQKEPERVKEVDENGAGVALLAAQTGNLDIMEYIAENTMSKMEAVDKTGRNCLHYAISSGKLPVVQYLTEKIGLSPLTGDWAGITPYQLAHEAREKELEEYFYLVTGSRYEEMYHNPVRNGFFPDPSIVRVGEDYYMVNSSFIYFPCIPISHSKDLIHWKIIGHAITNRDWSYLNNLEGGRGYWAPDISYNEGRFYITATYRMNDTGEIRRKQMVVSSDRPEGPYCEPVFLEEDGIDPSIFTDDDGRRYMLLNRGARIFEISQDATKRLSKTSLLYYGDNKHATEGPHLLKKDGWYYLFLAEGGTGRGHRISVARSETLFGKYEPCPFNPIMTQSDSKAMLQCCGHGKPVMTQAGDWYMVYLCSRYLDDKYGMLGRETALDPIIWTADGWPMVNNLQGPSVLQKKPELFGAEKEEFKDTFEDTFEDLELGLEWMSPRSPELDGIKIIDNQLRIKSSRYDLNSMKARNVVVFRQKHFDFEVSVQMIFPLLSYCQEAGLVCYYDENTYLKYALYKSSDEQYELRIFEKNDDVEEFTSAYPVRKTDNIYLRINTKGLKRSFLFSYDGKEWTETGKLDQVYYLCSEALNKGKRFTGAAIGMYAFNGEEEGEFYGKFKSFRYMPQ